MNPPSALSVGVDLGGTKVEAVVLEHTGGAVTDVPLVRSRLRVATGRENGYDHIVATVVQLVADVVTAAGLSDVPSIGIGMPGYVTFRRADGAGSKVALVKNANTTCLNGRPFHADVEAALRKRFPGLPAKGIAFANDANCFAMAEATYGAARDARLAFGAVLGTGVGGGVVVRSGTRPRAWSGGQGIAGEWGHIVLDPSDGPPCYCGRRGCVEQFLSGPAIERAYERRSGARRSVAEIGERAVFDADARATLGDVLEAFGRSMATILDVLDPDVVVLGGGVSNLRALYDRGRDAITRWVFNDELRTPILRNELGDSAGVFGAALLTRVPS